MPENTCPGLTSPLLYRSQRCAFCASTNTVLRCCGENISLKLPNSDLQMAGASWCCCFNAALLRSPADGALGLPPRPASRIPSGRHLAPPRRHGNAKPHRVAMVARRPPALPAGAVGGVRLMRAVRRRRGSLGACVAHCPVSGRRKRHGRCWGLGWFHAGGAAAPAARYGVRPGWRLGAGERRGRARCGGASRPSALLAVPSARSLVPTAACLLARSCASLPVFALFFPRSSLYKARVAHRTSFGPTSGSPLGSSPLLPEAPPLVPRYKPLFPPSPRSGCSVPLKPPIHWPTEHFQAPGFPSGCFPLTLRRVLSLGWFCPSLLTQHSQFTVCVWS